jgi:hypothetical protein
MSEISTPERDHLHLSEPEKKRPIHQDQNDQIEHLIRRK